MGTPKEAGPARLVVKLKMRDGVPALSDHAEIGVRLPNGAVLPISCTALRIDLVHEEIATVDLRIYVDELEVECDIAEAVLVNRLDRDHTVRIRGGVITEGPSRVGSEKQRKQS